MNILTTSQLTFYDFKDSYSVEITPDYVVVNCDEKGISKEITEVNISYGVYCGRTRISGTAVLDFEINGEKIEATVQDCSSETDGSIQFSIPANIDFTNIESAHIVFFESTNGDGDTFTFDKYVQFIKAVDGASGTGLIFKVYSENGTIFREDMDQINLETVVFVGESNIGLSDSDYIWEYDNGENSWVLLGNGPTFTVNKDDVYALKTIRCTINYNGNTYEDYISLTNDVVIYTSEVKYLNGSNILTNNISGSNVFYNSDKYVVAYMALYKNGEEIDALPTNKYANALSIDNSGVVTTDVDGTFNVGNLLYFIYPDTTRANVYNIVLGKFDGTNWNVVEPTQSYIYQNSKSYNNLERSLNGSAKMIIVSKAEVNKTLAIYFSAYKPDDLNNPVSTAYGNVVDTNDPIISTTAPESPVDGTLWIDISTTPYIMKVCQVNKDGPVWVDSNQQIGGKVHTSKPSSYLIDDVWILNDGETCFYSIDGSKLPSGYTSVEYIQSSGSQYIDTGFKPKYNSRVVMDISDLNSSPGFIFGVRDTQDSNSANQFNIYRNSSTTIRSDYFGTNKQINLSDTSGRTIVDKNGNTVTMFGTTIVNTAVTSGECANSLYLFILNNTGANTMFPGSFKLYSCQIYDNDILVRDFVPCIRDSDSSCGLYDKVNNVFYSNSGTGKFIAGDVSQTYYEYGAGSMLRSSYSRTEEEGFVASDWSEIKSELTEMRDNVAQYFQFSAESGLIIGQKDQKFYVNISATEMGFYDNSNNQNEKVVSIGNQAAKIKHLTVEEQTSFNCNCQADFNSQINMNNPYSAGIGFAWKIETDGSLSLVSIT